MHFEEAMENVVKAFEVAGVVVLAIGALVAFASGATALRRGDRSSAYEKLRREIGRAVLLGLEILIVADIVLTITVDPTLESAVGLGLIVLVRTFLSFSLEIELEGTLPWRRASWSTPVEDGRDSPAAPPPGATAGAVTARDTTGAR